MPELPNKSMEQKHPHNVFHNQFIHECDNGAVDSQIFGI